MPAQTPAKALKAMLVSTTTTATTTPAFRVLTTLYKKTPSNKGVADLSTVKYYNYNKFSHYATSYTQLYTKRTCTELARVEQGLESNSKSSALSLDSEN
jgi:hypothetical protein